MGHSQEAGVSAQTAAVMARQFQGGNAERRQIPLVAVTALIPADSQCWPVWLSKKRQIMIRLELDGSWCRYIATDGERTERLKVPV
jgi:hypothetical protein